MDSGLVDTTASSAAGVERDVVAATVATVTIRGPEPHDASPLPELEPGTPRRALPVGRAEQQQRISQRD